MDKLNFGFSWERVSFFKKKLDGLASLGHYPQSYTDSNVVCKKFALCLFLND
jgi:hypothetical protein